MYLHDLTVSIYSCMKHWKRMPGYFETKFSSEDLFCVHYSLDAYEELEKFNLHEIIVEVNMIFIYLLTVFLVYVMLRVYICIYLFFE